MDNQVKFIRKNGRIIPIRQKKEKQKQVLIGAGILGAAAVTDEVGKYRVNKDARKLKVENSLAKKYSGHLNNYVFKQNSKSEQAKVRIKETRSKLNSSISKIASLENKIKRKTPMFNFGVSALTGLGVAKIVSSMGMTGNETSDNAVGGATGILTTGAVNTALQSMKAGERQSVVIPQIKKAAVKFSKMYLKKKFKF